MSGTERARWERHFAERLARLAEPPAKVKLRLGQGVHVLCGLADDPRPFDVVLAPADHAASAWRRTAQTSIRYLGSDDLGRARAAWIEAVADAVLEAEADPGWAPFLASGAEAKGISVAAERPDEVITSGDELVIRLLEPCNARCDFCACIGVMADAAPGRELVRRQLVEGFQKGYRNVVFTGGEPTLLPDLPDTISLAREAGFERISLQTNGVRLQDEDLARRLAEAGLHQVLMSIHSHRAEVHDAVLKLPGALEGATAGIGHLMKHRVRVWLNFVVHTHNMADLHDFLLWVYRRWERSRPNWHGHVGVTLSYVAPIGWTLEHMEIVPRLSDAAPHLARALDLAEAVDLKVRVPGLCGVPLCTMPGYESFLDEARGGAVPRLDTRTWVPACDGCGFRDRCSGYWKAYFERHGTDEIGPGVARPWARAPDEPPPPAVLDAILKLARRGQTPWLIARALNEKSVRTPRGGRWSVDGIARLLRERGVPFVEELPPPSPKPADP